MLDEKLPAPNPQSKAITTNTGYWVLGSCTATPIHKVGSNNSAVLNTVQLRPPKIGTTKENSRRNKAPDSPGSAASQNN